MLYTDTEGNKESVVNTIIKRYDTKNLEEFSNHGFSLSDLSTALNSAYDAGFEARDAIALRVKREEPQAIVSEGAKVTLQHSNKSILIGTMMREGLISTPAAAMTLADFGQRGWMVIYIDDPSRDGEDDDEQ